MDAKLQLRVQRYGWDAAEPHYEECWSDVLVAAHDTLLGIADVGARPACSRDCLWHGDGDRSYGPDGGARRIDSRD